MNKSRLLIVEDEPLIRVGIRNGVSILPWVEVAGECESVADAVTAILASSYDLVLLDVQLPDGTGFDVVRKVGPARMPAVIFVTAYDQYAVRAFEVNAIDYVLKPFDAARLRASLERARRRAAQSADLVQQLQGLIESHQSAWLNRLVVRNGERFDVVPLDSIEWIESANNYSVLHCRSNDFVFNENLAGLEQRLNPKQFLRVHRGHMVNLDKVVAVNAIVGGSYELQLKGGAKVRTGRQYANVVRALLKSPG